MEKSSIRKEKLQWRTQLSEIEVKIGTQRIINNVFNFFDFQPNHHIHLFLPISDKNELNTWLLLDKLVLVIPLTQCYTSYIDYSTQTLHHTQLYEGIAWQKDKYGIPVPDVLKPVSKPKLDFIFVPLLAFNEQNHRIGYGKGYYDVFLKEYKKTTTIGLALEGQRANFIAEKHDIPLKYIVTEQCIAFRKQ